MERTLGRILLMSGLLLAALGALLLLSGRLGWLGRLPGDIRFTRDGMSIYIPVVTCVLISIVITLILNLLGKR